MKSGGKKHRVNIESCGELFNRVLGLLILLSV